MPLYICRFSHWRDETHPPAMQSMQTRFSRLAHEGYDRYNGKLLHRCTYVYHPFHPHLIIMHTAGLFGKAKLIYSKLVSAEGHRNYPLREAKCLRSHPDLLLPLAPWLENWGRQVGSHLALTEQDRVLVVKQLLRGCDSHSRAWCVPGQVGYFRALYGISTVLDLDKLATRDLDKDCRAVLKGHDMRAQLAMTDEMFATKLGRQARELLASH